MSDAILSETTPLIQLNRAIKKKRRPIFKKMEIKSNSCYPYFSFTLRYYM
jgi:hypothetical protein